MVVIGLASTMADNPMPLSWYTSLRCQSILYHVADGAPTRIQIAKEKQKQPTMTRGSVVAIIRARLGRPGTHEIRRLDAVTPISNNLRALPIQLKLIVVRGNM